jgi:hypothetical protein
MQKQYAKHIKKYALYANQNTKYASVMLLLLYAKYDNVYAKHAK